LLTIVRDALNAISGQPGPEKQPQSEEHDPTSVDELEAPPDASTTDCRRHLQLCISRHRRYEQISYSAHGLDVDCDKMLYDALRAQYSRLIGRWGRYITLRRITRIRFVKVRTALSADGLVLTRKQFRLRKTNFVEVEAHSEMSERLRESLPPENDKDYNFAPPEPEFLPPIGHNEMLHYFYSSCEGQNDDWHVRRFPGHKEDKISFRPEEEPKYVWGIQVSEKEDREWLYLSIPGFAIILASTVVGIVWSVLTHDYQSAFTVASYMVVSGLALLGSIQVLLENA
jgi:hypothetical protein